MSENNEMTSLNSKRQSKRHYDKIDTSAKLPPSIHDLSKSLKERVWIILNRYPHIEPRHIMKILGIFHDREKKNAHKIRQIKYLYGKRQSNFSEGLKRLSFHKNTSYGYVPTFLHRKMGEDRKVSDITKAALKSGWLPTNSKNRMILWKDPKLGTLKWFETGRVNAWFKKPISDSIS